MRRKNSYLKDARFLQELISETNIVYYIKISILNWDEQQIKEISGKAASPPSISVNGNSAIRRTGSVSFVLEENDKDAIQLLQLNKKIYLEIGQQNKTDKYPEFPIIWFPMGLFIITSFSFSHNLSGVTANLSLKDKMCLLNGQFGGTLPAATVFDNYEVQNENGEYVIVRPTIYQIIMELVNHFGGQQIGNIIISDLETRVKQIMEWTGSVPLYVLQTGNEGGYYFTTNEAGAAQKISEEHYISVPGSPFEAGSNVGFILTDFSYPGDLIGNAGESVVTILDKIKNTLGNFEYFYDLDGHFRFQEIKNYLNNSQSKYILESLKASIANNGATLLPDYLQQTREAYSLQRTDGRAVFSFKQNKNLVTSYANTPQIQNIKNDFIVWGLRKTTGGQEYPIRYHLAIDKKPQAGNTYEVIKYVDLYDETTQKWYKPLKYSGAFPDKGFDGVVYYNSTTNKAYVWKQKDGLSQYVEINATLQNIKTKDWRTQLYFQGVAAQPNGVESNFYYSELLAEWPKIYDIQHGRFREQIVKDSSRMDYYLDFINPMEDNNMKKFSVGNIGRRSVIVNKNNDINCVFEPYVPDVIIINTDFKESDVESVTDMRTLRDECMSRGLAYTQVNGDIYDYLVPGRALNSGYEEVRQMLYQYINYCQNVTLQTLPVYFLEPNTCIEIQDEDTQIQGTYIINSLAFSLDSLSINASKIISKNI